MKFRVDKIDFKKAIEGAMLIAKISSSSFKGVVFSVIDNKVRIRATNLDNYIEYVIPAKVYNMDYCTVGLISYDDIKKFSNISGVDITIDFNDNNRVRISNDKKTIIVSYTDITEKDDSYTYYPNGDEVKIMSIQTNELIQTVNNLVAFTSKNELKPILAGFNFNCNSKTMNALDGCHAGIKRLNAKWYNNELNFTVNHYFYNVIKKIYDGKETAEIFYYTNFIQLKIENIIYSARLINEEYHPIEKSIHRSFNRELFINAKELLEICKEYKGYINIKNPCPIYIAKKKNDSDVYIVIKTSNIEVCTKTSIKISDDNLDFLFACKIQFAIDCFTPFKGEEVYARFMDNLNPIILENDEYITMLLPVRLTNNVTTDNLIQEI